MNGLYKKARAGQIPAYTGIPSPYELPDRPECVLDTVRNNQAECLQQLNEKLRVQQIITEHIVHSSAGLNMLTRFHF